MLLFAALALCHSPWWNINNNGFCAFIGLLGSRVLTTALLSLAAEQRAPARSSESINKTPECIFSKLQHRMAHANWKAAAILHNWPLQRVIIHLALWPWIQMLYNFFGALLKNLARVSRLSGWVSSLHRLLIMCDSDTLTSLFNFLLI